MSEEETTDTTPQPKESFLSDRARYTAYRIVNKCLEDQIHGVNNPNVPYVPTVSCIGLPMKTLAQIEPDEGPWKPGYDNDMRESGIFNVDYYDRHIVHRFIEDFFNSYDDECTGVNFIKQFRKNLYFPWGLPHLKKLLKEMGYCKRRVGDKMIRFGLERLDIAEARRKYLEQIKEYRQSGRSIFYIDETWIDRGRFRKYWRVGAEDTIMTDVDAEDRLILIHAGSKQGFLDEAKWLFQVNETQDDLQVQMGKENFELWINNLLLPNLPPNSVVVMDSASYHNEVTEDDTSVYKIDKLLNENGHSVCRIPPNMNPEFNPLMLAWEKIAKSIDKDVMDAKEHGVHVHATIMRLITLKAVSEVTAKDWQQFESKVKDMENIYRLRDRKMEEVIQKYGENFDIFEDILSSDSDSD